jgi:hypothetical protein
MEIFENYLCRWPGYHALWLRRNLTDLRKSTILDWKEFIPRDLYDFHETNLVFTLRHNGSKLFLGHLQNNSERDLQQYLSAAFPLINLDECGQFSGEAYRFLKTRNRVNRECKQDQLNELPVPVMMSETNPIGPHWMFYKTQFVDKKPYDPPEGARKDRNGRYWTNKFGPIEGEWNAEDCELVFNPDEWDYVHSTILDNPYQMERDPDYIRKLQALPEAEKQKYLYGSMDSTVGQYFDCWDDGVHVVDLETDPQAVIWQPWQPRWIGWDWGRAHWTAMYWFTIALVRSGINAEYKQQTVCYREYVDRNKDYKTLADVCAQLTQAGLPGNPDATSLNRIFLSHEQFNKRLNETQAPSMVISRHLTERGLPAATRFNAGSGSRIAKATLVYDMLRTRKLVVTSNCLHLIEGLPTLIRDEANLEDVFKVEGVSKADDCYDAFASGLYSWYGKNAPPQEVLDRERLNKIADPFARRLEQFKLTKEREKEAAQVDDNRPAWMS